MTKSFFILILLCILCIGIPGVTLASVPDSSVATFSLPDEDTEFPVDYWKYGQFTRVGTSHYRYQIGDRNGLSRAAGIGVYPNTDAFRSERRRQLREDGCLDGSHWSFINTDDMEAAFYKWTTAPEDPGVRQYFTAEVLKAAGHLKQAVKAYYAVIVHFPRSACWGADGSFVWYVAPVAIEKINLILREHPELELCLVGASVEVQNKDDTDLKNDIIIVHPGQFVKFGPEERAMSAINLSELPITETRGQGYVQLVKYSNGHWQMLVNGKPLVVKGISYSPTKVGEHISNAWMFLDTNENGKPDAPYDSWVDKNRNGIQDPDELAVGDFQLMKEMGVNAVRLYRCNPHDEYSSGDFNKPVLRDMYQTYGIRVILGDYLGAYTMSSGANWAQGTDYTDPEHLARMKEIVRELVLDHKNEPYVLAWLLGNENNMSSDYTGVNATRTNADKCPRDYAKFLNEVAQMIHSLDPNHPVIVGNVELGLAEYYAKYAPELDVFGVNSYRGQDGFGNLWKEVASKFDRAVLITEYGCDAYREGKGVDEEAQARYHRGCWEDIAYNLGGGMGKGNAIGGMIFEFLDEFWKAPGTPADEHCVDAQIRLPFPDGWSHEEWLGICGQGDGSKSPFLRELRKTYFLYKDLWNRR